MTIDRKKITLTFPKCMLASQLMLLADRDVSSSCQNGVTGDERSALLSIHATLTLLDSD